MGSLSMGMTYGHIAEKDSDPILDRTHELASIVSRIITPERAALFAAFPFREYLNAKRHVWQQYECSICLLQSQSYQRGVSVETMP